MKEIIEILKNKAFYIAIITLFLSVVLFDDISIGMIIICLYGFLKEKSNVAVRAIFVSILLFYLFAIINKFLFI